MGPQGCGKGTQADFICKKLGIPHISTGDLLRNVAKRNQKIKSFLDSGQLIPNDMAAEIVQKRIVKEKKGFVLEGFPRNITQAKELEKFCKPDIVILVEISGKESVRRLSSRMQCRKCSAIYGDQKKPLGEGRCDACKGELYRRDDDKPDAIRKRLAVYHTDTEPIIKFYEKKGMLHRVSGERPVEDVRKDIEKILSR